MDWDRLGRGRTTRGRGAVVAVLAGALFATTAQVEASVPHVVQPGETLWSIAAANNLTTRTVAAFNGLSEDSVVSEGQTVNVPTVEEGAAALIAAGITPGAPASDAAPASSGVSSAPSGGHVVLAGESLSSVAAANGVTVEALAAANGLAADAILIEGQSIGVPAATASTTASGDTAGLGHIPSPSGELHLDPAAADSWNAMREDSAANYGVDLYPAGPVSAHRTYEQQAELYDLYLSGQGAPANPPGTSSHEQGLGVDVAEPVMRDVVDQIGAAYGWAGTIPSEWWHVAYGGG